MIKCFVWKQKSKLCEKVEWIEMNYQQFKTFKNNPENHDRYFIKLNNDICFDDDIVLIETTEADFQKWCIEYEHHKYLKKLEKAWYIVSLDTAALDFEGSLHDIVSDDSVDIQQEIINRSVTQKLYSIQKDLGKEEKDLIYMAFCKNMSTVAIASVLGVSQQAVSKRIIRLLDRMKNNF